MQVIKKLLVLAYLGICCIFSHTLIAQDCCESADDPIKNDQDFENYFKTEISGKPEGVFIIKSKAATIYPIPDENSNPVGTLQKSQKIHAAELREDWIKIGEKEWVLRKDTKSLK